MRLTAGGIASKCSECVNKDMNGDEEYRHVHWKILHLFCRDAGNQPDVFRTDIFSG